MMVNFDSIWLKKHEWRIISGKMTKRIAGNSRKYFLEVTIGK